MTYACLASSALLAAAASACAITPGGSAESSGAVSPEWWSFDDMSLREGLYKGVCSVAEVWSVDSDTSSCRGLRTGDSKVRQEIG